jgi:uncharacterized protein with ParB-like and HNH nuclease domain
MINISNQNEIQEEFDDSGKGLWIEREKPSDTDSADIDEPWKPEQIRVDPKVFSIRYALDMIDEGELDIAPDFQRRKVWTTIQRSRLIESILLRIPLPAFYFSEDESGKYKVVDGSQRLSAIYDFVRGGKNGDSFYPLSKLEYLKDELVGKRYEDLKGSLWTRRIDSTQLSINVIAPSTPSKVKFNIFKRINTGGTPLNEQEIRHCMSEQRSRNFLKKLISTDVFNKATSGQLKEHERMFDRELAIRFCAFRLLYLENSKQLEKIVYTSLDGNSTDFIPKVGEFLNETTQEIDSRLTDDQLSQLERDFKRAMINAFRLFGENAFRKWPIDNVRVNPINRALFEVWSTILADYEWNIIKPHRDKIVEIFREMMTNDDEFIFSVSSATGSVTSVKARYSKVMRILNEVGL